MLQKTYFHSPIGCIEITGSDELGISAVHKVDTSPCPAEPTTSPVLAACVQQLDEYFHGRRRAFDLPLDWGGAPDFYKAVWKELLAIPYGQTRSYQSIAEKLGDINAVRAVGRPTAAIPLPSSYPAIAALPKTATCKAISMDWR